MRTLCLALVCLLWLAPGAIRAADIYACTDGQGQVRYQDTPCQHGRQRIVSLRVHTPAPAPPPTPTTTPARAASQAIPPATIPPPRRHTAPTPPPVVYRCTRATDGTTYLRPNGHTRSYLVPLGMLDWTLPLAQSHGSAQGAGVGMSAPELRPAPSPRLIGGGYWVRVRDACQGLPPAAACAALEQRYQANHEAMRQAFKDEREPLRQRQKALRARMAGCR